MYYGNELSYYGGYILVLIGFVITFGAQTLVKGSYSKYKKIANNGKTKGVDVARIILDANDLKNVKIEQVGGELSDHYDPRDKVVRLSSDIYNGTSVAAMAVAAHECGHAIQDKLNYGPLRFRSSLVPVVNLCDRLGYIVIMIGLIFGFFNLSLIGLIILGAVLLFQLVTLPVEFNASSRAKKQIDMLSLGDKETENGISKMLTAAALTYVASVINTLFQLLRMFLMIIGNRRRN